jgi:transcriptional regulator with XRE-family HTH domain
VKPHRSKEDESAALKALGAAVIRERNAKGLTQEDVAYVARVALRTLQNLETGSLNVRYTTLRAIAKGIGLPVAGLLEGL